MLFALIACTEPVAPKWSEATSPTVLRDTEAGTDAGTDTGDTADTGTDSGDTATDTADTATDSGDTATDTADTATDSGTTDTGSSVAADAPGDWSLDDLNPNSPRFGEPVSPRDYISRVSGYYFIHST